VPDVQPAATGARVAARAAAAPDPAGARTAPPPWQGGRLRAATLASVAMAAPSRVVPNSAVAAAAGVTEAWIVARTGVRERRVAAADEGVKDLAARAARAALDKAGVAASDLDLVLVATLAADDVTPNAAPLVAHELGAERAGAIDLGAACSGFVSALSVAAAHVESGRAERVLAIGAEVLSRFVDPSDRGTASLFADGAGAAVVGPAGEGGGEIGPIVLHADGAGGPAIRATQEERVIRMQGHDTFREAVRRLSEVTVEVAAAGEVPLEDVDLFVFHQANARILAAVAERLGLAPERVVDCIDRYGNTSAATIPIALAEAERDGRLAPGATVLLAAFGAGFTWGGGLLRWP
jgi:3-oxoacyl-[acyl-carrier-protein] synthase III